MRSTRDDAPTTSAPPTSPDCRVGLGLIENLVPFHDDVLVLTSEPTDGPHHDVVAVAVDPDLAVFDEFQFEVTDIKRGCSAPEPLTQFLFDVIDAPYVHIVLLDEDGVQRASGEVIAEPASVTGEHRFVRERFDGCIQHIVRTTGDRKLRIAEELLVDILDRNLTAPLQEILGDVPDVRLRSNGSADAESAMFEASSSASS